jgi:hypothetical protein
MGRPNKKQYAIFILLLIAFVLYNYNNLGNYKPIFNPINIVVYCLAGSTLIIILGAMLSAKYCPNCGARLPGVRLPKNNNEMLYGWTTCPNCKAEIDNNGQIVNRG